MKFPYGSINFILYSISVSIALYAVYLVGVKMTYKAFSLYGLLLVVGLILCTAYLLLIYSDMVRDISIGEYDWN